MILSKTSERLYLQKDGTQNIYIELLDTLPQHQINGIRFLFRQFKKKTPGVILNDPSGYGKCLQVTLFVNALRPLLKNPVLVLTDSVSNWKDHFETWTDCGEELAIETTNPFTKKLIYINQVKDGVAFSRRTWSIVVLHDEGCIKQLLPLNLRADYKIWVTRDDLKENLNTLASIYEWLHPNQKFKVSNFTATRHDAKDVIEKAILLDAFSEDFLIRRTDFLTPFEKPERFKPVNPATPPPIKTTRKNKDPTGTKVKRSKKRLIVDQEIETSANLNQDTIPNTIGIIKKRTRETSKENDSMDVESFIRNERPISSEDFIQNDESQSLTVNVNVPGTSRLNFEDLTRQNNSSNNSEDDCTNKDSTPILRYSESPIQVNENIEVQDISKDASTVVIVPSTEDVNDSQSVFQSNAETKPNNVTDSEVKQTGVYIPETEDELSQNEFYKKETAKNTFTSFKTQSENVPNISINSNHGLSESKIIKDTSKNWDLNESENCGLADDKFQNQTSVAESSAQNPTTDWKINVSEEENVLGKNLNNSKSINGEDNMNSNIGNDEVVKRKNINDDLDAKLAELEEKAVKRLKDSILDSLF